MLLKCFNVNSYYSKEKSRMAYVKHITPNDTIERRMNIDQDMDAEFYGLSAEDKISDICGSSPRKIDELIQGYELAHTGEHDKRIMNLLNSFAPQLLEYKLPYKGFTKTSTTELMKIIEAKEKEGKIKKCSRFIPSEISKNEKVSLELIDISVKCKRNETDDVLYSKDKLLLRHIPRGCSILKITNEDGVIVYETVIYANKKFYDHREPVNNVFIEPVSNTTNITCMEKMNGDAAHFSGRFIGKTFYLFAGSKNKHIVFKNYQDLNLYDDKEHKLTKRIAELVLRQWCMLPKHKKNELAHFLDSTQCTVVCEFMQTDNQHIVKIHYDKLVCLFMTPPPSKKEMHLTLVHPKIALPFLKMYDFDVVFYEEISYRIEEIHKKVIKNRINSEGMVLYYTNKNDKVIGMLKEKTIDYTYKRALRQQAINSYFKHYYPIEQILPSFRRRINEVSDFLCVDDEVREKWFNISDNMVEWLVATQNIQDREQFIKKYPDFWENYVSKKYRSHNTIYNELVNQGYKVDYVTKDNIITLKPKTYYVEIQNPK